MKTRILIIWNAWRGEDTAMSEALSEETGLERKELIRRAAKVYLLSSTIIPVFQHIGCLFYRVLQSFY